MRTDSIEKYPAWVLKIRKLLLDIFNRYSIPRWMVFVNDNLIVYIAFILAYLLRFNMVFAAVNFQLALEQGLIVLAVYAVFSLVFHSYSGLLRHTTLTDISLVFIVTTVSLLVLLVLQFAGRTLGLEGILKIPMSILLIHYVLVTVALFFERVFIKIVFRFATMSGRDTRNVLIYGAGDLGFVVKRVILSDPRYGFHVKGFISKDRNLQGKKINGIQVYDCDILSADFIRKHKIESLILADEKISIDEKSRIIRSTIKLGLETLETPEVDKWLNGQLNMRQFQRVKLEDLLGREPINLNMGMIKEGLQDKTILVTGAAGSIGSEIVRQLARFHSRKVILIDQAETPIFYLERELREKFVDLNFLIILSDVTNRVKMEQIFKEYRPDIVFHAAAYKHVSLMEENPHEAIRINVGGTRIMTELAVEYGVSKFVMISTDKSVNPTGVMGASKRICEKVVQARSQTERVNTQFIITRFGNVLGSNGSVIPLFSRQIQNGGPVTVTHPEVYRYFMTIPEACQLVLEAGFMGNGGEIFVFDMGEPVKIADLARNMILLSGYVPDKDIKIIYTGLRPGEKLFEELLTDKETTLPTHHAKIKKAGVEKIRGEEILNSVDGMMKDLYSLSKNEVVRKMINLVPEFVSKNGKYNGELRPPKL
ncbi:MAG TPA: nucleoside-diphosphate sugar epimerase/dehydratase [Bacteroidales bacterium]|nr:nucleoside-diphosphate sugar epimerase/dehydratase [Bacteroidales bacterium]